jgi:hypothetical protein
VRSDFKCTTTGTRDYFRFLWKNTAVLRFCAVYILRCDAVLVTYIQNHRSVLRFLTTLFISTTSKWLLILNRNMAKKVFLRRERELPTATVPSIRAEPNTSSATSDNPVFESGEVQLVSQAGPSTSSGSRCVEPRSRGSYQLLHLYGEVIVLLLLVVVVLGSNPRNIGSYQLLILCR